MTNGADTMRLWRRFRTGGIDYLAGEAAGKGLTYVLFIALASQTTPVEFGHANLFIALSGILALVASLGLPDGAFRFHFQAVPPQETLGAALLGILAAAALLAAAVLPAVDPLARFLGVPPFLLRLSLAAAPAIGLRQLFLAALRARQASRPFALARTAEPLLMLLLALPALPGPVGARPVLLAYTGAIAILAVGGMGQLAVRPGLALTTAPLPRLLAFSLPLVLHALAMLGLTSLDQIVINQLLGPAATGLYAYAYRFGMAMSLVAFALSAAWSPLVLAGGTAPVVLRRLAVRAIGVAAGATVALALALPPLAALIGGPRYQPALGLIPVIAYGYLWAALYGLWVAFLIRRDQTPALALLSGAAAAVNLAGNYLLVPRFGIAAAAWTTVGSYALLSLAVRLRLGSHAEDIPTAVLLAPVLGAGPLVALAAAIWR